MDKPLILGASTALLGNVTNLVSGLDAVVGLLGSCVALVGSCIVLYRLIKKKPSHKDLFALSILFCLSGICGFEAVRQQDELPGASRAAVCSAAPEGAAQVPPSRGHKAY